MRLRSDLLGEPYPVRLSQAEIDAAVEWATGRDYLWPTLVDLAMALSLRSGDRPHARVLSQQRAKAPLGEDVQTLTQLLHVQASNVADAQSLPELGHLGAEGALSMFGTARTATLLALASAHGDEGFAAALVAQARLWDAASEGIERASPRWSLDPRTRALRLTVTVRGNGGLHACAGWALNDLVYAWPLHIRRLVQREVPLAEVRGAKTRNAIAQAVEEGRIEAVADLQGPTLSHDDLTALVARQDAGLAWIRANHVELAALPAGLRVAGA